MTIARNALLTFGAVVALLLCGNVASAAIVRYHYVPAGPGPMTLAPGPTGAPGELINIRGRQPYNCPPRPTCLVTFKHCFTGALVVVPLALPEGTPQMMHRGNRTIYNYGSYTVTVQFLEDGSVDVIYNSGLFREI
ncbi:MAG: hypothetical protein K2R98_29225 [Gemmataceae bacterium]|nr:hypothetical protein [Gemmataceae bacterium]